VNNFNIIKLIDVGDYFFVYFLSVSIQVVLPIKSILFNKKNIRKNISSMKKKLRIKFRIL